MADHIRIWYEARRIGAEGSLERTWDTLADARRGIDTINRKRAKPTRFAITQVRETTTLTDQGQFRSRVLTELTAEVYPAKLDRRRKRDVL